MMIATNKTGTDPDTIIEKYIAIGKQKKAAAAAVKAKK